jgi:hypothetical protein
MAALPNGAALLLLLLCIAQCSVRECECQGAAVFIAMLTQATTTATTAANTCLRFSACIALMAALA